MVCTVTSGSGGLKIVNDNNYVYRLVRKYWDKKTYWICEVRECKARLHTYFIKFLLFYLLW